MKLSKLFYACSLLYRRIDGEIRKCRLPRFPYGVIYRIKEDNIEIIAIKY